MSNSMLAPVLDRLAAIESRLDKLTATLAELHTVRLPEKRGAEALAETERRFLADDIRALAEFDMWAQDVAKVASANHGISPPEDHQGSRQPPPVTPRPGLVASPEVGAGDAPQGLQFCCLCGRDRIPGRNLVSFSGGRDDRMICSECHPGIDCTHHGLVPVAGCFACRQLARATRSVSYCAICDGDELPAAVINGTPVRLKGGGFVCEGCVA